MTRRDVVEIGVEIRMEVEASASTKVLSAFEMEVEASASTDGR